MSWHVEEQRDNRKELMEDNDLNAHPVRCTVCKKWLDVDDAIFFNPRTKKYDERIGLPYCFTHDPMKNIPKEETITD